MEQGRNGTVVKHHCRRTLNLNFGELIQNKNLFFFYLFLRAAPAPKYLKMHYVKEELGDGKGMFD